MTLVSQKISQSMNLINWLDDQIGEPNISSDFRSHVSGACISLARQHHRAIVQLVALELPGSAAALLRVIWEAYIKGVWLHRCAKEKELEELKHDELDTKFGPMICDIEQLPDFNCGVLSLAKRANWGPLCSHTHTGYFAISRQLNDNSIESNFSQDEICEMLNFGDSFGRLAALQLARLSNNDALAEKLLAESADTFEHRSPKS
jgi:hypothetical protein